MAQVTVLPPSLPFDKASASPSLDAVGLYASSSPADRLLRELTSQGRLADDGRLPNLSALFEHDQLHYYGTRALDKAIRKVSRPSCI